MDDIRRPQPNLPRRNYALPGSQPAQPPTPQYQPQPQTAPQPLRPVSQLPAVPRPVTAPQPAQPVPVSLTPEPIKPEPEPAQAEPLLFNNDPPLSQNRQDYDYHHAAPTQPDRQSSTKSGLKRLMSPKIAGAAAAVILVLAAGGLLLSKPPKKVGATAAQLAKKSSFSFYYPQPLPAGFSYVGDLNAFDNGQAYYMLASGKKHIVVHEQPASLTSSPAEAAKDSEQVSSAIGKVAIGTTAGEISAQVNAGSTYILINTTGSVSKADLINTINNLKIIK